MEDKLLELKQQFCSWHCPNKGVVYNPHENCDKEIKCDKCGERTTCEQDNNPIELCGECQIQEYILFIRDELGGR